LALSYLDSFFFFFFGFSFLLLALLQLCYLHGCAENVRSLVLME